MTSRRVSIAARDAVRSMLRRAAATAVVSALAVCGVPLSLGLPQSLSSTRGPLQEPIAPIPRPPLLDPRKVALGERLFADPRLSRGNARSCSSCHDLAGNGASRRERDLAFDGAPLPLNTSTVFNAVLSFRLGWEGRFRTLEAQVAASLESPGIMGSSVAEAVRKLAADPKTVLQFQVAYGRAPDASSLLDALATFERSLLTPGSRFDRWLGGETDVLSAQEIEGYELFKSLGCVSCHQGVNVGGNLFQRHGIFRPLATSKPEVLRVPSLRNIATTAPYFHDGSAPTLDDAVRKMGASQLNSELTEQQIGYIVAFLGTLTGTYHHHVVGESR